jgi:hypothetical protein
VAGSDRWLSRLAANDRQTWGIAQKQTGADRLTMAGTMAANAHGRGLRMKPLASDVESFVLVDAAGVPRTCSRTENPELFSLVHGGYGLFGIVTSVQVRLVPRRKIERVVEVRTTDGLMAAFEKRIADGFLYGDFQFAIERDSDDFLHKGVFSCYRPVAVDTPMPPAQKTTKAFCRGPSSLTLAQSLTFTRSIPLKEFRSRRTHSGD